MPAGKRQQSNAMLYTLITFVGLFIAATTFAVIYYVKAEEHRTKATTLQGQINELATGTELRKIGTIVGAKQRRKSRLGTMVNYLDEMVSLIIGGLPEETSAEVKVETTNRKVKDALKLLAQEHLDTEEDSSKLAANEFVELVIKEQFSTATKNFDETMKNAFPTETLEGVWKSTTDQLGPFKRQIGVRTEKQLGYDVVFVTCEFEKGHLDVKVVYNSERQIAGLNLVPTPPEVLKSYQSISETKNDTFDMTAGLIQIIEKLKIKLDNTTNTGLALKKQLEQLQNRFDDAMAASFEKEQALLAEKEKYQQQINDIKRDYDELKALVEQTSEQQVKNLIAQRDEARAERDKMRKEMLKTQAERDIAEERMRHVLEDIIKIKPLPDSEGRAFEPDGKIMLIDDQTKIVHLNIGSDDRVYPGLTFSVYDKNMPIPKDGKGKAEITVFDVGKNISAARITRSEIKRPIILDDIVANLIWNSYKTNVFVVAGEFDLDSDGDIDYDAVDKLKTLIEKWGGRVADAVSIDTDFLVLGRAPEVRPKPDFEEMEEDPMAMEKYEASLRKLAHYKEVQSRAQALYVPVFNAERFLYFIGYKAQASRAGAF